MAPCILLRMRRVKGCLAILLTMGALGGCEEAAPTRAAIEVPWPGERVEGRPSHCLNLISRPENRRLERWKDGERLSPLPCDRVRCAAGQGQTLATYDGADLLVRVAGGEPLKVPGGRVAEVSFTRDGATIWQRKQGRVWVADPTTPWDGGSWQLSGLQGKEELASLHIDDGAISAVVGRRDDCKFVDRRRMVLAGQDDPGRRHLIRNEHDEVVGKLVDGPTGWKASLKSGESVDLPAALLLDDFGAAKVVAGWLYVYAEGGTFTHQAGEHSHLWSTDDAVTPTPVGPRVTEREGIIRKIGPDGKEQSILNVKPRHDLMGRPLPDNLVVERRAHYVSSDGIALWGERLRRDDCTEHYRLYWVDLATAAIRPIADGEGGLTMPFLYEGVVHWIESDVRYEMVALQ